MKFVLPDDYEGYYRSSAHLKRLAAWGEVASYHTPPADEQEALERLRGADVIIAVRERTPLDRRRLEQLPALRLVSVLGTATTVIDRAAAAEREIAVRTTPAVSDIAVAEHAFALMLGVVRRLPQVDAGTRSGAWPTVLGTELHGKTLGIVGLGSIGRRVGRLAVAFGMKVVAYGRPADFEANGVAEITRVELDELLRISDFVSVHLRLADTTRGLLSRAKLELLQPHAIVINTARAELVDEDALRELLVENRIGGAGLDVFTTEPVRDRRWADVSNAVVTSHRAWMTHETVDRLLAAAVDNVIAWLGETKAP